ncbi:hypothetical protein CEXT_74711 [Caerostris extrusa]|uniref:Uncharacterized protein n=1 Tax=Caerostris extrusa TaxID=172846 RepID=A0AAV4T6Y1_CAEEX|nr:hypothetical protein CEXT_74711 [Caerostris extrusa]
MGQGSAAAKLAGSVKERTVKESLSLSKNNFLFKENKFQGENGDETANMTSRITCPLDTGVVSLPAMQRTRADAGIDATHSLSPHNERSLYIDIRAIDCSRLRIGKQSPN